MASFLFLSTTLLVLGANMANAAYCHGKPSPDATPNVNPIMTAPPKFVKSVANGKLYTVGSGDDEVDLVHLYGTPYQMGYAHGELAKDKITSLVTGVMKYIDEQAAQALNQSVSQLKPWFVDLIADVGVDVALDLTEDATSRWTGAYYKEELKGTADATGLDLKLLVRIHMIGELTKGSCSMYGAWGNATASTGSLMQLRALDWDVDGPFRNFPEIIVYHPNTDNGHAFINVAWSGFIGSITGISSKQMAISEIGVSFPDASFGKESRFGVPFTYLLRDILQFDEDLGAAEEHIKSAKRTCDLIFGVGDGKSNSFRSVQYSASVANFFTDTDMEPYNQTWHPRMNNIVYYGMDWLCPGYTTVLHRQLEKYYGNITAVNTIENIVPIMQSGNLHIAVYDLTKMVLHVANARRDGSAGPLYAYQRSFLRLDVNALFAEQAPKM